VDFVGYRHWTSHVRPRKRTLRRTRKTFKRLRGLYYEGLVDLEFIRSRVASFAGYMRHCDAHTSMGSMLENFVLVRRPGKKEID
jgi:hypothetical protein